MKRVLLVCLGNICRSPMAEGLFRHRVGERGLSDRIEVDSAGTGSWHVGEPPDPRTMDVLQRNGIALDTVARQVIARDAERFDLILTMDDSNLQNVRGIVPASHHDRVRPLLSIVGGGDVPDPYYGGRDGFDLIYRTMLPAVDAWIDRLLDDAS